MPRLIDRIKNTARASEEGETLAALSARLRGYAGSTEEIRKRLLMRVGERAFAGYEPDSLLVREALQLCLHILVFEELFFVPELDRSPPRSTTEAWERTALYRRQLAPFERPETVRKVEEVLGHLLHNILPEHLPTWREGTASLAVPLYVFLPEPARAVEGALGVILNEPRNTTLFPRLWDRLEANLLAVSGIDPDMPSRKQPVSPTKAKELSPEPLIEGYLAGTPIGGFLQTQFPFSIPLSARFEHMHVLGGSGHGKTQLLQSLMLCDLTALTRGQGSLVVIDSQGDMLQTILRLAETNEISDRVVYIDPTDIEYPPCLNLFDFGLERLTQYTLVDRERLINGAIALYEYLFGALLGAELTQRQGVVFRYLARLLMVVPGATVRTLLQFMENPESTRLHLARLDPMSRQFFETQFFSTKFDDTRQQILTRLWGVLSNSVLARMFSHSRNTVDLFAAMNRGSIILINTAKDLLKQDGCALLGRFFIALIAQAVQERAVIPADRRRATFVYIDEAQDYFDEGVEQLLNQARKYKVGLILAHQNLGQLEPRLQAAIMASTTIKVAGGVSARDAGILAREMQCEPEFLQGMRKRRRHTEFACFIRNVTAHPIRLPVPFGQMEERPRMGEAELQELLAQNRARYCASGEESSGEAPESGFNLGEQEVL